jgi:hypothetical protein
VILEEDRLQERGGVDRECAGCWCGGHEESVSGVQAAGVSDAGREPEVTLAGNGVSSVSLCGDDNRLL